MKDRLKQLGMWPLIVAAIPLFFTASAVAEHYHIYILTGQSNALGTTRYEGKTAADFAPVFDQADQANDLFWSNVRSDNTTYPPTRFGDSAGQFKPMQIQQGGWENPAYWGPEIGFARAMHGLGHERVRVIKACRGGGGNSLWDLDIFREDADAGHMWGHLVDTIDLALAALVDEGHTFEVSGLLYLQGESNDRKEAVAAGRRLHKLSENLKTHINARHDGAAAEMRLVIAEIAGSDANLHRRLTTTRHKQLAANHETAAFVQTADLPVKEDDIHFGRDAKLQIGYRMATAMHGLLTGEETIQWTGGAETKLWIAGENWAGNATPWPQRDYVADGVEIVSCDSDSEAFNGRSLTLRRGATYQWFRTSQGEFKTLTHRIDELTLESATICPGSSRNSVRHTFQGRMTLAGDNTFDMSGAGQFTVYLRVGGEDSRDIMRGDGTLELVRDQTGTARVVEFAADASAYQGDISMAGFRDKPLSLHLHHPSGWGNGALQAGPYSEVALIAKGGVSSKSASIELDADASLNLGTGRHVIASLVINGQSVTPGLYDAQTLKQLGVGGTFSGEGRMQIAGSESETPRIAAPDTEQRFDGPGR